MESTSTSSAAVRMRQHRENNRLATNLRPPLNAAEQMRRYRTKIKSNVAKDEEIKQKDRERQLAKRSVEKSQREKELAREKRKELGRQSSKQRQDQDQNQDPSKTPEVW